MLLGDTDKTRGMQSITKSAHSISTHQSSLTGKDHLSSLLIISSAIIHDCVEEMNHIKLGRKWRKGVDSWLHVLCSREY